MGQFLTRSMDRFLQEAIQVLQRAVQSDTDGHPQQALPLYIQGIDLLMMALDHSQNEYVQIM